MPLANRKRRTIDRAALDQLARSLNREWLIEWLKTSDENGPSRRRMPHFALSAKEAAATGDYLLHDEDATLEADDAKSVSLQPADRAAGESLFVTVGCLACHRWNELGASDEFAGGDLTLVAHKRPTSFFVTWLTTPHLLNRDHRMPVFDLTDEERHQLASLLARSGFPARHRAPRRCVRRRE